MRKSSVWLMGAAIIVFLTSGCVPLVVGSAALGTAGTYYYVSGEMHAEYAAPFDKAWAACEKTLAELRALDVLPYKEIGKGDISALVNGEKVRLTVTYKGKNTTAVSVRVGMFGNKIASQLLLDKIGDQIARN